MATTTDVSEDLLQQMARVIVREVKPERIVLFGSHARGEAGDTLKLRGFAVVALGFERLVFRNWP